MCIALPMAPGVGAGVDALKEKLTAQGRVAEKPDNGFFVCTCGHYKSAHSIDGCQYCEPEISVRACSCSSFTMQKDLTI